MIVCTFAGHRKIFGFRQQQVIETLEKLLETEQKMICYVGGAYAAPKVQLDRR